MVAIQLMDSLASCSAFRRQDMGVRKPHWTQLGSERIVGEPLVDIRIEPLHVREHSVGDFVMEADDDCVRGAASGDVWPQTRCKRCPSTVSVAQRR